MDRQQLEFEILSMFRRSDAWFTVWDLCIELGMDSRGKSGLEAVLDFIRQAVEQTDTESATPDTDKL